MTKQKIIEKVASGLRYMGEAPDAFVYSPLNEEETWSDAEILGIPVFHFDYPMYSYYNNSVSGAPCPFMPIWKSDRSGNQYLSKRFFEGWEAE